MAIGAPVAAVLAAEKALNPAPSDPALVRACAIARSPRHFDAQYRPKAAERDGD